MTAEAASPNPQPMLEGDACATTLAAVESGEGLPSCFSVGK